MFGSSGLPKPMTMVGPVQQTTKTQQVPAPNGGINVVDMLAAMPATDSIFQYNLIPNQYGSKVRTGYTLWGTAIGAGAVNTVLPYNGSTPALDKLFAVGTNGIFDITSTGANNPAALITFGTIDSNSGIGGWMARAVLGSNHFLQYTDESNGYFVYTEGGGWALVTMGGGGTQISGVDPSTFVWVMTFKERSWFVQRNTATAWYLSTGAVFGAAAAFNFGDKFKHGGNLVALYTWTLDGGNGIDDYLVAVSSGGDVLIYQGSDPSVATSFSLVGSWYIGPPPAGRRIAGSFGGDLYLLSSYGLIPLSKLIAGVLIQDQSEQLSRKITPLIKNQMNLSRTLTGWEVRLIPSENILLISTPKLAAFAYQQFVQSLNTQGWALYRDIPYNTGDAWNGAFYIGTADGRVLLHTGHTDISNAISWSALSSFQDYGEVGNFHRVQFIRAVFLAAATPSVEVEARYDYNLSEVLGAPTSGTLFGFLWDSGLWDSALWSGDVASDTVIRGGAGMGRAMAIGVNGSSTQDTTLIRFDLMYDTGNYL